MCVIRNHIASITVPWLPMDPDKSHNYTYPSQNLVIGFTDGYLRTMNRYILNEDSDDVRLTKLWGSFAHATVNKTSRYGILQVLKGCGQRKFPFSCWIDFENGVLLSHNGGFRPRRFHLRALKG